MSVKMNLEDTRKTCLCSSPGFPYEETGRVSNQLACLSFYLLMFNLENLVKQNGRAAPTWNHKPPEICTIYPDTPEACEELATTALILTKTHIGPGSAVQQSLWRKGRQIYHTGLSWVWMADQYSRNEVFHTSRLFCTCLLLEQW